MDIPYSFFRPGNGCFGTHSGAFCRLMVTSEMLFDEKYFEFDAQNCFGGRPDVPSRYPKTLYRDLRHRHIWRHFGPGGGGAHLQLRSPHTYCIILYDI